MNGLNFWRGAGVALVLSLIGAIAFSLFSPLVGTAIGARGLIVGLSLAYLLFLLYQTQARSGRLLSMAAWLFVTALLFLFNPTILLWLFAHVGLVWLMRCFYRYGSLWTSAADALLNGLALMLALATAMHTRSVFLSLWCFFLLQALYVYIPSKVSLPDRKAQTKVGPLTGEDNFERAYRTAEVAFKRLSARS